MKKMNKITEPVLKKRFGQHLLTSSGVLDKILHAAAIERNDTVLEIGPGTGILTKKLLENARKVVAVEYDKRMVSFLQQTFTSALSDRKLELLNQDFAKMASPPQFDVCVANIPYEISSIVVGKLLAHELPYRSAVLMFQEEFANRLLASPGTSDYSRLTVNTSVMCTVERICQVDRNDFRPPPKVDSSVVRISRHLNFPLHDLGAFDSMLRICFHRKHRILKKAFTSRSALSKIQFVDSDCDDLNGVVSQVIGASGFDVARAVQISPVDFISIFEHFKKSGVKFTPVGSRYIKHPKD